MVNPPDEDGREQILRLHLRDEQLGEDMDLRNIASKTHYYSGSDLNALCVSAAMASVKDAVGDFSWTSHIPDKPNATDDQAEALDEAQFHTRTITLDNFTHAINEVPPSSSAGSHSERNRWHEQFGRKRTLDNPSGPKPQINGHMEKSTHSDSGDRGRRYGWRQ